MQRRDDFIAHLLRVIRERYPNKVSLAQAQAIERELRERINGRPVEITAARLGRAGVALEVPGGRINERLIAAPMT